MDKLEKLNKLAEKAEAEIREKRILGGMDLFNLKKGKYVVFSKEDYDKLIGTFDN